MRKRLNHEEESFAEKIKSSVTVTNGHSGSETSFELFNDGYDYDEKYVPKNEFDFSIRNNDHFEIKNKPTTVLASASNFVSQNLISPVSNRVIPHIKQQLREMIDDENNGSLSPVLELIGGSQMQAMLLVWLPTHYGNFFQTGNYSVDVFLTSVAVALIVASIKVVGYALKWLIEVGEKEKETHSVTMKIEYYRVDKWGEPQVNLHHQSISWLISTRSKNQTNGDFRVVPYEPEYNDRYDEFDGLIPEFNLLPRTDDELIIEHEGSNFSVYFQFAEEAKKNENNKNNNNDNRGRAEDMYGGNERGTPRTKPEPPIIIRRNDSTLDQDGKVDLQWMEKFLFNVSKAYVTMQKKNQTRARFEHNGYYWRRMQTLNSNRGIDSVALDIKQEELLHRDLETFHHDKQFYERMGLPYRRGYLFSGKPGTGKTSLINAISFTYGRDIYSLNLKEISDDSSLQSSFASVPKNSIIVLEDVDAQSAVVHSRERRFELRKAIQSSQLAEMRNEEERKRKLKEKQKIIKQKKKDAEKAKKLSILKKKKEKKEAKKKAALEMKLKKKEKERQKKLLQKEKEKKKKEKGEVNADDETAEEEEEEEDEEESEEEQEESEEEQEESEEEQDEEVKEDESDGESKSGKLKMLNFVDDDDVSSLPDTVIGPSPFSGFGSGGFSGGAGGFGSSSGGMMGSSKDMSSFFGRITLSALLNCLDGHSLAEGVIIVLTSNHPEILDPALIRPGRIDLHLKLGYCTRYQLASMYRSVMDIKFKPLVEVEEVSDIVITPAEAERKKKDRQQAKEESRIARLNAEQNDGVQDLFLEIPEGVIAPCDALRIMVLQRSVHDTIPAKLLERSVAILDGNKDAAT
ncbi:hypothetical protein HK096_011215 [Nowakowskiella sp. JEL0078]|nr:hypothetical protein HK096_011215 [Nowakowskiella sp. JEL0078]